MSERPENDAPHHPDCPARYFADHPERCRCVFMAMLDRRARVIPPAKSDEETR